MPSRNPASVCCPDDRNLTFRQKMLPRLFTQLLQVTAKHQYSRSLTVYFLREEGPVRLSGWFRDFFINQFNPMLNGYRRRRAQMLNATDICGSNPLSAPLLQCSQFVVAQLA